MVTGSWSLLTGHCSRCLWAGDEKLTIMTTPGCFGVGVKFGPVLGEMAADFVLNNERDEDLAAMKVHSDGVASGEEDDDRNLLMQEVY